MIYRWKHAEWQAQVFGIIHGFAEIVDGIVTVSTLGFYCSSLASSIAYWRNLNSKLLREAKEREVK